MTEVDRPSCACKSFIKKSIEKVDVRIDGIDKATIIKTGEIDRRLLEHNELRKEVLTDRAEFVRKEAFEFWKDAVNEKLTTLMNRHDKKITAATWTAICGVFVTVINLVLIIIKWN